MGLRWSALVILVIIFPVNQFHVHGMLSLQSVVVESRNGLLRGLTGVSRGGRMFHQFLGVPYAEPPLGDLRFEDPVKMKGKWAGIKNVLAYEQRCLQFEDMISGRVRGKEDCLYLNVFTPKNLPLQDVEEELFPVMIFIHGGGFNSGNPGIYDAKYFMDEDVVIVTFAYRIGSFGFLSSGDEVIRGNMGLKDQLLVLQWVQENIKNFGGDPGRVTLFGESSGASSVHWHILSEKSRGLFHRAISQTGSAIRWYPNTNDYEGQFRSLAKRVGCPAATNQTTRKVTACLKKLDAQRIVETHRDVSKTLRSEFSVYGPTLEAVSDDRAFITELPETLIRRGDFSHVDWITGINSADGIIFATRYLKDRATSTLLDSPSEWASSLPKLLRYDPTEDEEKNKLTAEKIRTFYFGDKGLPSSPQNFQNLTNMFSDRWYFLPNYNAVFLQGPKSPTFLYYFDYRTVGSFQKVVESIQPGVPLPSEFQIGVHFVRSWIRENVLGIERPFYGAGHADELFLLFNLNAILEIREGSPDYEASKAMVKTWVDFATGNYGDNLKYNGTLNWPRVQPDDERPLKYLRIGRGKTGNLNEIVDDPIQERMLFWKSLNLTFLGRQL